MKSSEVEILLVEDNPTDVELTLRALKRHNLANKVHVVTDGEQALEFLFANGSYKDRDINKKPKVILLDLKLPKVGEGTTFTVTLPTGAEKGKAV